MRQKTIFSHSNINPKIANNNVLRKSIEKYLIKK